ncbi:acetyl-CoA hydrolase/transferase C-terminal domain-containing protein [Actinomycetospora aeridis]|uniref:Acetyl-CoA hydrolase/transferase C-terminal domain-containing protein n=1 Tax=Actinomycetospora aeridis TaxID=3129231 RepID=A0ABU8ND33_9PSEU
MTVAEHLRPGDTVLIGQTVAEPPVLVDELVDAARTVEAVTAVCGYVTSDAWRRATPGHPRVVGYAAAGALRTLAPGVLDYLPVHLSRIEDHVTSGQLPVDVVLLQVGPADADGYHDLGAAVDYVAAAAQRARVVLAEIHEDMPRTRSRSRLHRSRITEAVPSRRPLPSAAARPPSATDRAVAAAVVDLVPDHAVIQMGIGGLPDAVASELRGRRGLRVRSGLVGDWLLELAHAGALAEGPGTVVAGMALGSPELYAFLDGHDGVEFAPGADAGAVERCAPFVSVNSALEVDLLGQVGAEFIGDRLVGGVGGQADFFRAAHRGGDASAAVVALPSVTPTGASRIVARVSSGVVTSSKSDVDVVVTEWGAADLRACTVSERLERLVAIAHPDHRAALGAARPA